jgi:hypothetical protein
LTHLPGVRDYLRNQKDRALDNDIRMQLLAEHGPQNVEDAWIYFKHWVKGRPFSDAVALPARFEHQAAGARADTGGVLPTRMHAYDPDQPDHQPGVLASDRNAHNAAVAKPGDPPKQLASERDDFNLLDARQLKEQMKGAVRSADEQRAEWDVLERENQFEDKDVAFNTREEQFDLMEERQQAARQAEATAPATQLLPAFS